MRETRSHAELVGDARLRAATGRTREEWYALLDAAGAAEWDHARIARWLGGEHDVDGWWAQGVTVSYEQARGLRRPGQRSDGRFEAGVSKTLYTTREALWPHLADAELRGAWLDVDLRFRSATEPTSVRLEADDGSRVTLYVDPQAPGRDGRPKVRLSVQHVGLPGVDAIAETKAFWKACLAELAARLAA